MKNKAKTATFVLTLTLAVGVYDYSRKSYPHWLDEDKDCRNTRHEVLASQAIIGAPIEYSEGGCKVLSGSWVDMYTGQIYNDPKQLDIDHIIPLAHAHKMGATGWSRKKKAKFANDLTNLLAVSAQQNRQKGAKAPHEWMPLDQSSHCRYIRLWLRAKLKYKLYISAPEAKFLIKSKCDV